MNRISLHEYFGEIAMAISKRSPCLSRRVGCVLVDKNKHILSTGYNGPPSGIDHCALCHRKESGRNLYSCSAVHAEMNALLQCPDVQQIFAAYVTVSPCMICARLLANTQCEYIAYTKIYTDESYAELVRFWEVKLGRKLLYLRGVQPDNLVI